MATDINAVEIIRRHGVLSAARSQWESQWNDIQQLVRPNASYFSRQGAKGDRRVNQIMDGTAVDACEESAAGLQSYCTNPSDRWFDLTVENSYSLRMDPAALEWLEIVSDIIYAALSDEACGFNTSMHENYLDAMAFGTSCIYQSEGQDSCLSFRCFPLADCWFLENNQGRVDTVYRQLMMTGRQIIQEFADVREPFTKSENQDKEFTIIHAVFPRKDRNVLKLDRQNKPFASVWVCREEKILLREGGFDALPYHVPRWSKLSNEVYGRSPAMSCLPDIKMLNRMELTTIKAGQKATDPPLIVADDGFLLPIETHPGAIIFKDPTAPEIQTLEHKGNLPWAEDKMQQKRDFIRKCFHTDWLRREKKTEQQTATEINDDRDEMLRLLAPSLGRIQSELLGPLLQRSYALLKAKGRIPPAPRAMQKQRLRLVYLSPAARAQTGVKSMVINRFIQTVAPLAQVDPTVLDAINMDKVVDEVSLSLGVSRRIMRSPDEVAKIRDDKARQQQLQQVAGAAEPASKAVLNFAKARSEGAPA